MIKIGVPFAYVKHTPVGSTETTTFHDFTRIVVTRQMEAKTTSVQIILQNRFGKYASRSGSDENLFKEDDEIQIFANVEEIDETQHIILNMTVKEYKHILGDKARDISITGMDRTYHLLNKLYTAKGFNNADNKKPDGAIKEIIAWVSEKGNRNPGIKTVNVASTPTKKSEDPSGTATFNNVVIHLGPAKTAYEWIQEISKQPTYTISGTSYTSDRDYIFWVDEVEDFHWVYPDQTDPIGNKVIDVTESSPQINSVSFRKSIFDIVNMVIFNGGEDPSGKGILWYFYDETSKQPELRMKFIPMIDLARDIQANEKTLTTFSGEFPSSYPYTTSWNETVNNDSQYTGSLIGGTFDYDNGTGKGSGFRGKVRFEAEKRAKSITNQSGGLRWKGSIVMKGTRNYNPGDLVQITYEDANMDKQNLRVKRLEQNISSAGWFTTMGLEEDAKSIVVGNVS